MKKMHMITIDFVMEVATLIEKKPSQVSMFTRLSIKVVYNTSKFWVFYMLIMFLHLQEFAQVSCLQFVVYVGPVLFCFLTFWNRSGTLQDPFGNAGGFGAFPEWFRRDSGTVPEQYQYGSRTAPEQFRPKKTKDRTHPVCPTWAVEKNRASN